MQDNYFSQISRIINFFRYTTRSGFLFCACNDPRMILEINRQVIERSASSGISIEELHLDDDIKDHFIDAVKEKARKKPNGIIINNIDVFIQKTQGQILSDINFSREVMIELGVCFLFWFSEENLSEFSNRATDLYLRRDRSVIRFKETFKPSLEKLSIPHERIDKQFAASLKQRRVKIELLEKQLEGARKKTYKKERIAREIVFDLVNAYLDADDLKMALCLFKEFKKYFENSPRTDDIELMAWVYFQSRDFNAAETWYRKSLAITEKQGNEHIAASTYHQLGIIAEEKREFKMAKAWYKKSLEIFEKQGNINGAEIVSNSLNRITKKNG